MDVIAILKGFFTGNGFMSGQHFDFGTEIHGFKWR